MLALSAGAPGADYPSRPITLIVPWGAGGGTDAVGRMLASLLEKDFGQPVNVVNRTGGSGVVGHQAIATAAPDGYTIGLITFEITQMHHQGLTKLNGEASRRSADQRGSGGNPGECRLPYKTLPELVDAIRKNPASSRPPAPPAEGHGMCPFTACWRT